MVDHLQSGGMPMASLHNLVAPKMNASPIHGGKKWQSSQTNYIMHYRAVVYETLS